MVEDQTKYNQVNNIIRRSQALILNVKLLGADTSNAKELLDNAKSALNDGDFNTAIEFAKKSMVEVMELKKQVKLDRDEEKVAEDMPPESQPPEDLQLINQQPDIPPDQKPPSQDSEQIIERKIETAPAGEEIYDSEPKTISKPGKQESAKELQLEQFEEGFSYIIEETRANLCFKILSQFIIKNFKGLCICRTNPAIIRRNYELDERSTVLWLTDRDSSKEATISPSLESMIYVAEEFIDKNEKGVILLDGLEYLISNNSFNPVLRFIRRLIDRISETESLFLIAVSPKAINEQELKLLERELHPIIFN